MNLRIVVTVVGLGVLFSTVGYVAFQNSSSANLGTSETDSKIVDSKNVKTTFEIMETNGEKHIVALDKIRGGGPPKDGIPSIDKPRFSDIRAADFISDSDVVIGLELNDDARAYPLFILVWHEIVNDKVGGVPVAVTYCPLCYTSQVFKRVIDDQEVKFGTSGKLYNSNLVMYDRLTDSYWSQGMGMAIKGELAGIKLETIPFDVITWGDWKKIHPDSIVLNTDTGHLRSYGVDPYGNYYTEPRIMFPVDNNDDRLHPKEIIIGLNEGDVYKAFAQNDIEINKAINDHVGDLPVLLVSTYEQNSRVFDRKLDGQTLEFEFLNDKLIDTKTKSEWNYDGVAISGPLQDKKLTRLSIHPGFWFEWAAFHPNTLLYGEN